MWYNGAMKLLLARALAGAFDATLQVVCGALLACLAVALPSVWLGGKGVHPLRAVLGFLCLQPRAGRLVLCALLCLGVYIGGSKVDSSPRRAAPSAQVASLDDGGDGAAALGTFNTWDYEVAGLFPPWTNAVTNACVTGIRPGTTSDFFRVAWPDRAAWPAVATGWFEFFGRRDLAAGTWTFLGGSGVPQDERELVVEVPHALLPGGSGRAAFYTFGFSADTDGDGLSDLFETLVLGTRPDLRDTDGDLQEDGWEFENGFDPTDPLSFYAPYAFPFDLDGDGLENAFDPEPEIHGPDAHGANDVWYNAVCSNVFAAVRTADGVALSPRSPDVNTDAYFFVDVALDEEGLDAVAPIYFTADGPSRLGNPVLIPLRGETNRVPLLVGAEYCVTSPAPFSLSVVDEMYWDLDEIPGGYRVKVPVFAEREDANGNPAPVHPDRGSDDRLRGTLRRDGACCWMAADGLACYSGDSFCFCGGCANRTWYVYEEYALDLGESSCGCDRDPPGEEWSEDGAGASVSFSKAAVIFEDPYLNEPGWLVEREPTRTTLTVALAGGRFGGYFVPEFENIDRLATLDGNPVNLPAAVSVMAGETVTRTFQCRGVLPSGSIGDIKVGGVFMENMSGRAFRVGAAATSVRLELQAVYEAPENAACTNRHVYGVGEKVRFVVQPESNEITLRAVKGDLYDRASDYDSFGGLAETTAGGPCEYTCPISSCYNPDITITMSDVRYVPAMSIVEPQEVITRGASWGENKVDIYYEGDRRCWPWGSVGEAALVTTNYIGPMNVSFQGIAVSEIPCEIEDVVTGCFTNCSRRTHTKDAGAGKAYYITEGNYWFTDGARSGSAESDWAPGSSMVWKIPVGWHRILWQRSRMREHFAVDVADVEIRGNPASRPLLIGGGIDVYKQERHIDADGVFRTVKFGHWISRSRWCHVILDGVTQQLTHAIAH